MEVLRKILKDLSTNSRELNSGTHGNNTTATFGFKATEESRFARTSFKIRVCVSHTIEDGVADLYKVVIFLSRTGVSASSHAHPDAHKSFLNVFLSTL